MPYLFGALAGAVVPLIIWPSLILDALKDDERRGAFHFWIEALIVSEPIAIAAAFLLDLVTA